MPAIKTRFVLQWVSASFGRSPWLCSLGALQRKPAENQPAHEEDAALAGSACPVPQGSPGAWQAGRQGDGRQHQAELKNVK